MADQNEKWLGRHIATSQGSMLPWIWEYAGTNYIQTGTQPELPAVIDLHVGDTFNVSAPTGALTVTIDIKSGTSVQYTASGLWSGGLYTVEHCSFASVISPDGSLWIYFWYGIGNYPSGGYAIASYHITGDLEPWFEAETWDESPSDDPLDPSNMEPRGGQFADTDPYDKTDLVDDFDFLMEGWPFDPYNTDGQGNPVVGLFTPYAMTSVQLGAFGEKLFATDFMTNLISLLGGRVDPNAAGIVSLFSLPVAWSDSPISGSFPIFLCGTEVKDSRSSAYGAHFTARFKRFYFGNIILKEVWGSAKDYQDVDINIFLPYIGMRSIDPAFCVNRRLSLNCTVDFWTGDITYVLQSSNAESNVGAFSPIGNQYFRQDTAPYRWTGNCSQDIPFAVGNANGVRNAITSSLMGIVGAGAAAAVSPLGGAAVAGMAAGKGLASISEAHSRGPSIQSGGSLNGSSGYCDLQYAFIQVIRSVPVYPNGWRQKIGAPRYQTFTVGSLAGFTQFSDIHADAVNGASDDEKLMIEEALKNGVFLPE